MDLQPELLNRANKALVRQIETQEAKLAKVRLDLARVDHDVRAKSEKIARFNAQREPLDVKLSTLGVETESAKRRCKTAEREASALRQESTRNAEVFHDTRGQVEALRVKINLAKTKIQRFEDETKLSEEALAKWAEEFEALEGQAEFLSKLKAAEAERYQRARDDRDALNIKIMNAKAELQTEMQATEQLRVETERVLRDITASIDERNSTVRDLQAVQLQLAQREARGDELNGALDQLKAQVSRDATLKSTLEKEAADAVQQSQKLEAAFDGVLARRNNIALERTTGIATDRDADAAMLALEQELERAGRELALTHAAMQEAYDTLGKKQRAVAKAEAEIALAHDEWERVQAALAEQQQHDRDVDYEGLRGRYIKRLNATIADLQRGHRMLAECKQEAAAAHEESSAVRARIDACRRHRHGLVEEVFEVEQTAIEYNATLAALDRVRQLRVEHIRAAEDRLARYREALMTKASTLREVLRVGELVTGPLKAAYAGAKGSLSAVQKEISEMEGFIGEADAVDRLMEAEMRGLSTELQTGKEVCEKKHRDVLDVKRVKDRLQRQLIEVMDRYGEAEVHKEELSAELRRRMAEIDLHQDHQKAKLRGYEDERRSLATELHEKQRATDLMEIRYREMLKALYALATLHENEEDPIQEGDYNRIREEDLETLTPEEIHARHLANIAKVRMHLQERGDALDAKVVNAVKQNKKLAKAEAAVKGSLASKRREVAQIAWAAPTACEQLSVFADGHTAESSTDPEVYAIRMSCQRTQQDIDAYIEIIHERDTKRKHHAAVLRQRKADLAALQERLAGCQQRIAGRPAAPLTTPLDRVLAWAARLDRSSLLACRNVLVRHGVPVEIIPTPRTQGQGQGQAGRPRIEARGSVGASRGALVPAAGGGVATSTARQGGGYSGTSGGGARRAASAVPAARGAAGSRGVGAAGAHAAAPAAARRAASVARQSADAAAAPPRHRSGSVPRARMATAGTGGLGFGGAFMVTGRRPLA